MSNDSPRDGAPAPGPAAEQEGAVLAAEYFEKQANDTRTALNQIERRIRQDRQFDGDEKLAVHYRNNLEYFEVRAKGIRALLAAALPHAPSPPTGWQDISTAPKDGVTLILFERFTDARGDEDEYRYLGRWDRDAWIDDANGEQCAPTHWMPLPPSPQEPK